MTTGRAPDPSPEEIRERGHDIETRHGVAVLQRCLQKPSPDRQTLRGETAMNETFHELDNNHDGIE